MSDKSLGIHWIIFIVVRIPTHKPYLKGAGLSWPFLDYNIYILNIKSTVKRYENWSNIKDNIYGFFIIKW